MSWTAFFAQHGKAPPVAPKDRKPAVASWPVCPHCRQSMTGKYGSKVQCIRCTSNRRLTCPE